jgi:hypothetical protein
MSLIKQRIFMITAAQWLKNNAYELTAYQKHRFSAIASALYTVEFKQEPYTTGELVSSKRSGVNVYDPRNKIVEKCLLTAFKTAQGLADQ